LPLLKFQPSYEVTGFDETGTLITVPNIQTSVLFSSQVNVAKSPMHLNIILPFSFISPVSFRFFSNTILCTFLLFLAYVKWSGF